MKVNLRLINAELNTRLFNLEQKMLAEDNLQFFKDKQTLIERYGPSAEALKKSFIIGNVFRHRDSVCVPQYHDKNFTQWIVRPSVAKAVPMNFSQCIPIKEYFLQGNMEDTAIQNIAGSVPMSEMQFWLMLYALIIEPKLGKQYLQYELSKEDKYYLFHVRLDFGETVAVRMFCRDDEWRLAAVHFDSMIMWLQRNVFLFFNSRDVCRPRFLSVSLG